MRGGARGGKGRGAVERREKGGEEGEKRENTGEAKRSRKEEQMRE